MSALPKIVRARLLWWVMARRTTRSTVSPGVSLGRPPTTRVKSSGAEGASAFVRIVAMRCCFSSSSEIFASKDLIRCSAMSFVLLSLLSTRSSMVCKKYPISVTRWSVWFNLELISSNLVPRWSLSSAWLFSTFCSIAKMKWRLGVSMPESRHPIGGSIRFPGR